MNSHKVAAVSVVVCLALLIYPGAPSADAAVITMTGGDAGEGFAPLPFTYAAYNFICGWDPGVAGDAYTMQGVTFVPWDATHPDQFGVNTGSTTAPDSRASLDTLIYTHPFGILDVPPSSDNDVSLGSLMGATIYLNNGGPSAVTLTIPNLTPGQSYQVDIFSSGIDNDYQAEFTINGNANSYTQTGAGIFDVRETVTPDANNQIVITLTSSGAPDSAPYYYSRIQAMSVTTSTPTLHPGDFDGDGDVDGADFVAWQTHFPTASGATLADGDADGDGDVDGADFVVWQTNFPTTSGGASPVPEPTTWALALLGGLFALALRRSR